MAKRLKTHSETIELINAVKINLILWDCRHEEYKLAEKKPAVWQTVADDLRCNKGTYSQIIFLYTQGIAGKKGKFVCTILH